MKRTVMYVVCLAASISLASDEASEDLILSQLHRYFRAIRSVQFNSTEKISLTDEGMRLAGVLKSEYTNKMAFAEQSGNYRSELKMETPDGGAPGTRISLCAAGRYQFYDPDGGLLTLSSRPRLKNTSMGTNPLLVLFSFAHAADSEIAVSVFRDPQNWERIREIAKWQGIETFQGHPCAIMSFEVRTHAMTITNKTYFAEDLRYYPIHMESRTTEGTIVGEASGSEFQPCSTEEGMIFIPRRVSILGYDRQGKHYQTMQIEMEPNSLQVNHPIPNELFEIPPAYAESIVDADIGVMYKVRGAVPIAEQPLGASLDRRVESGVIANDGIMHPNASRGEPRTSDGNTKESQDTRSAVSAQPVSSSCRRLLALPVTLGFVFLLILVLVLGRRFMLTLKENKNDA